MISNVTNLKKWTMNKLIRFISSQEYLALQIDITNFCNLSCSHCYHSDHKNDGAISLDNWKDILVQYENLLGYLYLKPSIIICGGEPLLSKNLKPIVSFIRTKWPEAPLTILTNGTLLNHSNVIFLKENNIDIQVSIDGPDFNSHDSVRGIGSFNKSIEGIAKALENNLKVHILSVLSKRSSKTIEDFFQLASSLRVYSMNFTRLISQGNGRDLINSNEDAPLQGLELKSAYENILYFSKTYGITTNTNKPLFCLIDEKLGTSSKFGFQGIVIDYKGNLKVSSRTDYTLGNVLTESLEGLFLNSPTLKELRNGEIDKCGTCPYLSKCGGDRNVSFATSGNYLSSDPGCWLETVN
jgi:AdoMet-dependent heme synthase